MDGKVPTLFVCLDIKAAFDKVPHGELLYTLHRQGHPNWLVQLIGSYNTGREFAVSVGRALSAPRSIGAGTAQGAVLSATLYIADMPRSPHVVAFKYADDTSYIASGPTSKDASLKLNYQLDLVSGWFADRQVKANHGKF